MLFAHRIYAKTEISLCNIFDCKKQVVKVKDVHDIVIGQISSMYLRKMYIHIYIYTNISQVLIRIFDSTYFNSYNLSYLLFVNQMQPSSKTTCLDIKV